MIQSCRPCSGIDCGHIVPAYLRAVILSYDETRDEVLAPCASAAVLFQQADNLLARIHRKPSKKWVNMERILAEFAVKRKRTY